MLNIEPRVTSHISPLSHSQSRPTSPPSTYIITKIGQQAPWSPLFIKQPIKPKYLRYLGVEPCARPSDQPFFSPCLISSNIPPQATIQLLQFSLNYHPFHQEHQEHQEHTLKDLHLSSNPSEFIPPFNTFYLVFKNLRREICMTNYDGFVV